MSLLKYNNPEDVGKYYHCYSPKMYEYLSKNGFEPMDEYRHIETQKKCWIFLLNDEIKSYITSWSNNKVKK